MAKIQISQTQKSQLRHLVAYRIKYWTAKLDETSDLEAKMDIEDSIEALNEILEVLK